MELVLKLPQGKPPFIGLLHTDIKMALSNCEHLLEVEQPIALKINLDDRNPDLVVYIGDKEGRYLNIWTNEFFAARHYREFETADVVHFGPIILKQDSHSPIWSEKHKKWIVAKIGKVRFYFRSCI